MHLLVSWCPDAIDLIPIRLYINPITHDISKYVGSVEVGKLADLVLWKPENFGAKPEMVIKSGVIVWHRYVCHVFDFFPAPSHRERCLFLVCGAGVVYYGRVCGRRSNGGHFVHRPYPSSTHVHLIAHLLLSQMGDANASVPTIQPAYGRPMCGSLPGSAARNLYAYKNIAALYGLSRNTAPITGCRSVTKMDMRWNDALPEMSVDPESYEVCVDRYLRTWRRRGRFHSRGSTTSSEHWWLDP